MTQPAKTQEPSMEEILASIRRIIADDDASKTAQRTTEPPKAAPRPAAPPRSSFPPSPPPPEPEPSLPEMEDDGSAFDQPLDSAGFEEPSDILDLTEFDDGACAESGGTQRDVGAATAIPQDRRLFRCELRRGGAKSASARRGIRVALRARRGGRRSAAFERDERCGRLRFQHAGADRAGAECAHPRGLWCARCCGHC